MLQSGNSILHVTIAMARKKAAPVVLIFAGLDPCGGAGLCADIQAITRLGAHPAPLITAITAQNTQQFLHCAPVASLFLSKQLESVIIDMPIQAIKIGLIGSIENGRVIRDFIKSRPDIPVILDPIINSSTGQNISNESLVHFIQQELLPRATVFTPNSLEAQQLSARGSISTALCAEELLNLGVKHLLITGGHDDTVQIINHYFSALGEEARFRWPRLPGEFRGSGCTLAASIAALIAQGYSVLQALSDAQRYTWHTLKHARAIGQGQLIPDRFHDSTMPQIHDLQ